MECLVGSVQFTHTESCIDPGPHLVRNSPISQKDKEQFKQPDDLSSDAYVSAGQSIHVDDSRREYVPAEQGWQAGDPALE